MNAIQRLERKAQMSTYQGMLLLYMSGLNMMSAISNKEYLARLPPKPGSQLKKDGQSHLPGSSPTTS